MRHRRAGLLAEMGLAPLWRLRRRDGMAGTGGDAPVEPAQDEAGLVTDEVPAFASPLIAREARIRDLDWDGLAQAVNTCEACDLHKTRQRTVFGVGDRRADWLLIGEAPGAEEDRQGEPFVGQAGHLLDSMLAALDLSRGEGVYIANVLKCRPPGNRNPEASEVVRCAPHLQRQIALIQPRLILALGRFAAQTLLQTDASIASLRGRLHAYEGVPLIVTYHPAYLLRTLPDKSKSWADLVFAKQTMQGLRGAVP